MNEPKKKLKRSTHLLLLLLFPLVVRVLLQDSGDETGNRIPIRIGANDWTDIFILNRNRFAKSEKDSLWIWMTFLNWKIAWNVFRGVNPGHVPFLSRTGRNVLFLVQKNPLFWNPREIEKGVNLMARIYSLVSITWMIQKQFVKNKLFSAIVIYSQKEVSISSLLNYFSKNNTKKAFIQRIYKPLYDLQKQPIKFLVRRPQLSLLLIQCKYLIFLKVVFKGSQIKHRRVVLFWSSLNCQFQISNFLYWSFNLFCVWKSDSALIKETVSTPNQNFFSVHLKFLYLETDL